MRRIALQAGDGSTSRTNITGLEYDGSTHASGACRPGSIPGSPTKHKKPLSGFLCSRSELGLKLYTYGAVVRARDIWQDKSVFHFTAQGF